jgi:hypothetical protein
VQRGVWLRPFRDLIYTMPPYVIAADELAAVTSAMIDAARAGSDPSTAVRPPARKRAPKLATTTRKDRRWIGN